MLSRHVLQEEVATEVPVGVAPDGVDVVGAVLGVVELDHGDRSLDPVVVTLVEAGGPGPREVQAIQPGSGDSVHLEGGLVGPDPVDVALQQRAEPGLAGVVELAVRDAPGVLAHVHQRLAVLVADLHVVTADGEVAGVLDVADLADRLRDEVDRRDRMDHRLLPL